MNCVHLIIPRLEDEDCRGDVQVDEEVLRAPGGRLHHGRQVNREHWQIPQPQVNTETFVETLFMKQLS